MERYKCDVKNLRVLACLVLGAAGRAVGRAQRAVAVGELMLFCTASEASPPGEKPDEHAMAFVPLELQLDDRRY